MSETTKSTDDPRANWGFATLAVHGGYSPEPTTKAVVPPIYQTVAYAFDSAQHGADLFDLKVPGNIYTRIMNPTQDVLEQRLGSSIDQRRERLRIPIVGKAHLDAVLRQGMRE